MTPALKHTAAQQLLDDLERDGFQVTERHGMVIVGPASLLTGRQREQIREHRDELLWLLTDRQAVERAASLWHVVEATNAGPPATVCPELSADSPEYLEVTGWFLAEVEAGRLPTQGPLVLARGSLGQPVMTVRDPAGCWDYYTMAIRGGWCPGEVAWFLRLLREALQ